MSIKKVEVYKTSNGSICDTEAEAVERDFQERLDALLSKQETWHAASSNGQSTQMSMVVIRPKDILQKASEVIALLTEYKNR